MGKDYLDDAYGDWGGLNIDRLVIDPSFQVRRQTDHQKVREYARAMENGVWFPPLTVADVDGVLFLVDGFHRYEAYRSLEVQWVDADVRQMTLKEALRTSAVCNLSHGLPLTKTEKRRAFKQFIDGGGHLKGKRFKSYREIAQELQGIGGHTTIRGWMMKDFPKIARKMGDEKLNFTPKDDLSVSLENLESERVKTVIKTLTEARNLLDAISDPEEMHRIKEIYRELGERLEGKESREPSFYDDF